jgi:excisionase family DNA binding protein
MTPAAPGPLDPLAADHPSGLTASELRVAEATAALVLEAIEHRLPPTSWLSAQELADLLGVRRETVYRRAAELGGVRVGGAWRFDPRAVTGSASRRPEEPDSGKNKRKSTRRRKRRSGTNPDLLRVGPKAKSSKSG